MVASKMFETIAHNNKYIGASPPNPALEHVFSLHNYVFNLYT